MSVDDAQTTAELDKQTNVGLDTKPNSDDILVRMLSGDEARIQLDFSNATIGLIKDRIATALGIPPHEQRLSLGATPLPDDDTMLLAMAGCQPQAIVQLVRTDIVPPEGLRLPLPPGFHQQFELSCRVRFDSFDGPIPMIFTTDTNALQSHGLTGGWSNHKGHVCFYIGTRGGRGPHGRGIHGTGGGAGQGWVMSPSRCVLGQWHELTLIKSPRALVIRMDGEESSSEMLAGLSEEDFELRASTQLVVGMNSSGANLITGQIAAVRFA